MLLKNRFTLTCRSNDFLVTFWKLIRSHVVTPCWLDDAKEFIQSRWSKKWAKFSYVEWKVFFNTPDRSRSIPTWAHFPPKITWQNAEGSWLSGCLKCCKLLHVEKLNTHSEFNSSLIVNLRETYELSLRENMQTGRTDPQEIRNDQSTVFHPGDQILTFSFLIKNRLQLLQIIFPSSVVLTPKTCRHLVAFHD